MKYIIISLLFFFASYDSFSQDEPEQISTPVIRLTGSALYGRITDARTEKGIELVSVQLYGGAEYDSLITAMFTRSNGDFRFEGLSESDSIKMVISGIGYEEQIRFVPFNMAGADGNIVKDLGNFQLAINVQSLTDVVVSTQKQALEMGIDRKVFNVDQSLTATGGTATDVMKNIPSVSVDVDGNVTLRNSTPQIFVDGRPTILTLDQIPANDIERIELITNPSAKFDAASTGGIINVVMKRNKKAGLNGILSAGIGYPGIINSNLSLNVRQNRVNFFGTGSYNRSGGESDRKTLRENRINGLTDNYFNQFTMDERTRQFRSLRIGADYFMDNRNTLSLTQGIVKGAFLNEEDQQQQFLNSNKILERYGTRTSDSRSDFNRYNTQLNFTHKFPQQGKELTANINYNFGEGTNTSYILNSFNNIDGSPFGEASDVRNTGSNNNNQLTFQLDYVHPKGEDVKIETGFRSYINNYENNLLAVSVKNGNETLLPLSNNIEYKEVINALYFTYSGKLKSFSYQAGLRAEHSKFEGILLDTDEKFGYTYPSDRKQLFDALFPSLFITKKLNDKREIQLNYSRRIRRPNFWQLNPFININDPLNISQGNPGLRPEFTNSLELNYSQRYNAGNFLASVYYSNTLGDITRYSDTITADQYQQLNEAAIEPNAILNTFINANSLNRLGAEFTLQHKWGSRFDITPTINGEYQMVNAGLKGIDLSNKGFNWEAKLISNYRISTKKASFFNNMGFQLIGEYESPRIIPQGKQIPEYSVDVAIRKDFMKNKKASLTFSVNDLFWTDRDGAIYNTDNFYQETNRRNLRNFRLTFSYKFGNSEFKILNPKRDDNEME